MARKRDKPSWYREWEKQHRESQELFARMRERHRLEDEREERHRQRLNKLTFGLLGRPTTS
jgi:hypothetical protein